MKKKKPITFCLKCYKDDVYFVRVKGRIMIKCRNCNSYIKWSSEEECKGKWIINDHQKLF
jgi:hypothetical protein